MVVLVGASDALAILGEFARAVERAVPEMNTAELEQGGAIAWFWRTEQAPFSFQPAQSSERHQRHIRKYAQGNLGPDVSFYFRGPKHALNLRAQNLFIFRQLAQGVDDATWQFHLRRGDYSRWCREVIKDQGLTEEASEVEKGKQLPVSESRARIVSAIERWYTLPG